MTRGSMRRLGALLVIVVAELTWLPGSATAGGRIVRVMAFGAGAVTAANRKLEHLSPAPRS